MRVLAWYVIIMINEPVVMVTTHRLINKDSTDIVKSEIITRKKVNDVTTHTNIADRLTSKPQTLFYLMKTLQASNPSRSRSRWRHSLRWWIKELRVLCTSLAVCSAHHWLIRRCHSLLQQRHCMMILWRAQLRNLIQHHQEVANFYINLNCAYMYTSALVYD